MRLALMDSNYGYEQLYHERLGVNLPGDSHTPGCVPHNLDNEKLIDPVRLVGLDGWVDLAEVNGFMDELMVCNVGSPELAGSEKISFD